MIFGIVCTLALGALAFCACVYFTGKFLSEIGDGEMNPDLQAELVKELERRTGR